MDARKAQNRSTTGPGLSSNPMTEIQPISSNSSSKSAVLLPSAVTHHRTGYTSDPELLLHKGKKHALEGPRRLAHVHEKLKASNLIDRCVQVPVRLATDDEVLLTHSESHLSLIKSLETREYSASLPYIFLDDCQDTYACKDSGRVALLSAGAAIDVAVAVANGHLKNAFAAIRPPGHHCGKEGPQGFCLVNNVAIAANAVRQKCPHIERILIVDWDVHHGNGTEDIFFDDPNVLFFSMHRFEKNFFPETGDADTIGGSALTPIGSPIGMEKTHELNLKRALTGDSPVKPEPRLLTPGCSSVVGGSPIEEEEDENDMMSADAPSAGNHIASSPSDQLSPSQSQPTPMDSPVDSLTTSSRDDKQDMNAGPEGEGDTQSKPSTQSDRTREPRKPSQAALARGRTVNVPLPTALGDYDYLTIAQLVLLPIALEFKPQLIIVSAGFDPSPNDPLGGESVTPAGFYAFTRLLMAIQSKIVVCLEGGYHPQDVADCSEACLRALLGDAYGDPALTNEPVLTLEQAMEEAERSSSHGFIRRGKDGQALSIMSAEKDKGVSLAAQAKESKGIPPIKSEPTAENDMQVAIVPLKTESDEMSAESTQNATSGESGDKTKPEPDTSDVPEGPSSPHLAPTRADLDHILEDWKPLADAWPEFAEWLAKPESQQALYLPIDRRRTLQAPIERLPRKVVAHRGRSYALHAGSAYLSPAASTRQLPGAPPSASALASGTFDQMSARSVSNLNAPSTTAGDTFAASTTSPGVGLALSPVASAASLSQVPALESTSKLPLDTIKTESTLKPFALVKNEPADDQSAENRVDELAGATGDSASLLASEAGASIRSPLSPSVALSSRTPFVRRSASDSFNEGVDTSTLGELIAPSELGLTMSFTSAQHSGLSHATGGRKPGLSAAADDLTSSSEDEELDEAAAGPEDEDEDAEEGEGDVDEEKEADAQDLDEAYLDKEGLDMEDEPLEEASNELGYKRRRRSTTEFSSTRVSPSKQSPSATPTAEATTLGQKRKAPHAKTVNQPNGPSQTTSHDDSEEVENNMDDLTPQELAEIEALNGSQTMGENETTASFARRMAVLRRSVADRKRPLRNSNGTFAVKSDEESAGGSEEVPPLRPLDAQAAGQTQVRSEPGAATKPKERTTSENSGTDNDVEGDAESTKSDEDSTTRRTRGRPRKTSVDRDAAVEKAARAAEKKNSPLQRRSRGARSGRGRAERETESNDDAASEVAEEEEEAGDNEVDESSSRKTSSKKPTADSKRYGKKKSGQKAASTNDEDEATVSAEEDGGDEEDEEDEEGESVRIRRSVRVAARREDGTLEEDEDAEATEEDDEDEGETRVGGRRRSAGSVDASKEDDSHPRRRGRPPRTGNVQPALLQPITDPTKQRYGASANSVEQPQGAPGEVNEFGNLDTSTLSKADQNRLIAIAQREQRIQQRYQRMVQAGLIVDAKEQRAREITRADALAQMEVSVIHTLDCQAPYWRVLGTHQATIEELLRRRYEPCPSDPVFHYLGTPTPYQEAMWNRILIANRIIGAYSGPAGRVRDRTIERSERQAAAAALAAAAANLDQQGGRSRPSKREKMPPERLRSGLIPGFGARGRKGKVYPGVAGFQSGRKRKGFTTSNYYSDHPYAAYGLYSSAASFGYTGRMSMQGNTYIPQLAAGNPYYLFGQVNPYSHEPQASTGGYIDPGTGLPVHAESGPIIDPYTGVVLQGEALTAAITAALNAAAHGDYTQYHLLQNMGVSMPTSASTPAQQAQLEALTNQLKLHAASISSESNPYMPEGGFKFGEILSTEFESADPGDGSLLKWLHPAAATAARGLTSPELIELALQNPQLFSSITGINPDSVVLSDEDIASMEELTKTSLIVNAAFAHQLLERGYQVQIEGADENTRIQQAAVKELIELASLPGSDLPADISVPLEYLPMLSRQALGQLNAHWLAEGEGYGGYASGPFGPMNLGLAGLGGDVEEGLNQVTSGLAKLLRGPEADQVIGVTASGRSVTVKEIVLALQMMLKNHLESIGQTVEEFALTGLSFSDQALDEEVAMLVQDHDVMTRLFALASQVHQETQNSDDASLDSDPQARSAAEASTMAVAEYLRMNPDANLGALFSIYGNMSDAGQSEAERQQLEQSQHDQHQMQLHMQMQMQQEQNQMQLHQLMQSGMSHHDLANATGSSSHSSGLGLSSLADLKDHLLSDTSALASLSELPPEALNILVQVGARMRMLGGIEMQEQHPIVLSLSLISDIVNGVAGEGSMVSKLFTLATEDAEFADVLRSFTELIQRIDPSQLHVEDKGNSETSGDDTGASEHKDAQQLEMTRTSHLNPSALQALKDIDVSQLFGSHLNAEQVQQLLLAQQLQQQHQQELEQHLQQHQQDQDQQAGGSLSQESQQEQHQALLQQLQMQLQHLHAQHSSSQEMRSSGAGDDENGATEPTPDEAAAQGVQLITAAIELGVPYDVAINLYANAVINGHSDAPSLFLKYVQEHVLAHQDQDAVEHQTQGESHHDHDEENQQQDSEHAEVLKSLLNNSEALNLLRAQGIDPTTLSHTQLVQLMSSMVNDPAMSKLITSMQDTESESQRSQPKQLLPHQQEALVQLLNRDEVVDLEALQDLLNREGLTIEDLEAFQHQIQEQQRQHQQQQGHQQQDEDEQEVSESEFNPQSNPNSSQHSDQSPVSKSIHDQPDHDAKVSTGLATDADADANVPHTRKRSMNE